MNTLPFADQLDNLPESPDWLAKLRRKAAIEFHQAGLPTTRHENWKYTDLRAVRLAETAAPSGTWKAEATLPGAVLVEMDEGYLRENQEGVFRGLPEGVVAGSIHDERVGERIAHLLPVDTAIAALNTALFEDGFALIVPRNLQLKQPVEVWFNDVDAAKARHVRLLIVLEEGASATVVETHTGGGTNTIASEIQLGRGAALRHYRVNKTLPMAVRLATGAITLDRDSLYDGFSLTSGGRLSRHQVRAELNGPGAEVRLNGAHVLSGNAHADTTTEIRHLYPNCRSRETYRHVMDGTARSVFQGKIYVAEGAQKTDGFQLNQSLMLSPTAEVNAKPELEIYADDVKCSHGATSGRLDAEALFYLRSRGIPETVARQMLIEAFIGSSIDAIEDEAVREAFRLHAGKVLGTSVPGTPKEAIG